MDWTETLNLLGKWWNNGVAFANTTGLLNTLYILALAYLHSRTKKKNQDITIDVKQSSKETERLTQKVESQNNQIHELTDAVKLLTDLVFTFANSTKIEELAKKDLAKIYGQISTKDKTKVKEIVEKVKEAAETVTEKVVETVKEKPVDIYEQIKNSINN